MNCKICKKEYKGINGLAAHIRSHDMTYNEYRANYLLKEKPSCPVCGKLPRYNKIKKRFNKYCVDHANIARSEWSKQNKDKIFGGNPGWKNGLTKEEHKGIKSQSEAITGKENNPFYKMSKEKQKEARLKQAKSKKLTIQEIQKRLKNKKVELLSDYSEYKNINSKLIFVCKDCNKKFKTTLNNYLNGYKCPHCFPDKNKTFLGKKHSSKTKKEISTKIRMSEKDFNNKKREINSKRNIKLLCNYENYKKASDIFRMKCLDCNYIFKRRLSNQLQFNHYCPNCGIGGNGWEIAYKNYLDENNIKYKYHPSHLETPYGDYYPDFYLIKRGIFIEIKAKYWKRPKQTKKINWLNRNGYIIKFLFGKDLKEQGIL